LIERKGEEQLFSLFPIKYLYSKANSMFNALAAIGAAVLSAAIIVPLVSAIASIGVSGVGALVGAGIVMSLVS
jgi:hypothetical protein